MVSPDTARGLREPSRAASLPVTCHGIRVRTAIRTMPCARLTAVRHRAIGGFESARVARNALANGLEVPSASAPYDRLGVDNSQRHHRPNKIGLAMFAEKPGYPVENH